MEYRIGEFSQITRLTIKALRFYHETGLLLPTRIDESGYRWYDQDAIGRAVTIQKLKTLEFSLEEIREVLDHAGEEELLGVIRKRLAVVEARMGRDRDLRNQLIASLVTETGGEDSKDNKDAVEWITLGDLSVAALSFRGRYDQVGPSYEKLFKLYGRFVAGPPLALYHGEYSEDEASIEVCLPLRPGAPALPRDGVQIRGLAGQRVAQFIHRGPYTDLGPSYKKVFDFVGAQGLGAAVPSREVYLKGPGLILPRNPKRFVTLIQVPAGP